MISKKKKINK